MHEVLKRQSDGTFKKVTEFDEYKKAHRYICNIFYRKEEGLHWSYSLKYMMNGYCKRRIFEFGTLKFKRGDTEYKINSLS